MQKNMKIGIIVIVVAAVVGILAYTYFGGSGSSLVKYDNQPVPQSQMAQLSAIANNITLADKVGYGAIGTFPKNVNGTALVINGKPGILYIGADYCPYCAAGRWGLLIALMRFGSVSGVQYMTSSSSDRYPSTPTFTFVNVSYQSAYIGFISREILTNKEPYQPLQNLTTWENNTFNKYDTAGIPFIDFANKSIQAGANYPPGVLDGSNWAQIIAQLNNTNTTISQSVIGSADVFTVEICQADNFTPVNVCKAPFVSPVITAGG